MERGPTLANAQIGAARAERTHVPGEPGIWLFVTGDALVFSLFFLVFLYYRSLNPDLYQQSQAHLTQVFGALNTFLMLTSSWFVATGVHAARRNLGRVTPLMLFLAFACGVGFCISKAFEWSAKVEKGITLTTNEFFTYYFMFTGIHLFHVLIGMTVLAILAIYTRSGPYDAVKMRNLESGATFWHLVDLLWIVLFAILYLIR